MRCRNCGWDNPDGSLRCVKCNQPLTPSMAAPVQRPYQRPAAPGPAAPGPAQPSPHRMTVLDVRAGMEPPKPQLQNCPKCGYPVTRFSDDCPNCGTVIREAPAPAPAPAPVTGPRLIPVNGGPVIPLRPGTFIEIGSHKYRFEL